MATATETFKGQQVKQGKMPQKNVDNHDRPVGAQYMPPSTTTSLRWTPNEQPNTKSPSKEISPNDGGNS
jgi:hypothetical protein